MIIGVGAVIPSHGDMAAFMVASTEDFTIPGDGTITDMAMDGTTGAGEVMDGTAGAGQATDGADITTPTTMLLTDTIPTTIHETGLATISTIGVTHTIPAEGVSTTPIPGLGALP